MKWNETSPASRHLERFMKPKCSINLLLFLLCVLLFFPHLNWLHEMVSWTNMFSFDHFAVTRSVCSAAPQKWWRNCKLNIVQLGWICLRFIQSGFILVSPAMSAYLTFCPNVIHYCLGTSVGFNDIWLACVFGVWSDAVPEPVAMATNRLCSYPPHVFSPSLLIYLPLSLPSGTTAEMSFVMKQIHLDYSHTESA